MTTRPFLPRGDPKDHRMGVGGATTMVQIVRRMVVPETDAGAEDRSSILSDPLRGRAIRDLSRRVSGHPR